MSDIIADQNSQLLDRIATTRNITPSHSNISYLRRISKLCDAVDNAHRGAASRLFSALSIGFPERDSVRLSKLALATNQSACSLLAEIHGESYRQASLTLKAVADLVNISRLIQDGRSAKRIHNELCELGIDIQAYVAPEVLNWIQAELGVNANA